MKITSLAIDFGNTNTIIAVETDDHEIQILDIPSISIQNKISTFDSAEPVVSSVPTEVFCNQPIRIGKQAYPTVNSLRTASAYEFYGINFKYELLNALRVGQEYRPDHQSALNRSIQFLEVLCSYISKELEAQYGYVDPIPQVIASVPVSAPLEYINFVRTTITKHLACEVLKILDEATCAANCFDNIQQGDNILVIDIGGSTTDLSLVEVNGSSAGQPTSILLARNGLRFGGIDIDYLISDHILKLNELGEFQDHSIKTKTRILKHAEAAKKFLTSNNQYLENFFDPDIGMEITVSIDQSQLQHIINDSFVPTKLINFFSISRHLIEGAGLSIDNIQHMVFVGGTVLQPVVNKVLVETLGACGLPVPEYAQNLGLEVFSSVALGAISASKVEMFGQELLNSICLKIDGVYKPIFRKGQAIPAQSRQFALGKQFQEQTHLKFNLAELDSFSQGNDDSPSYRLITCNGVSYRMEVPSDTVEGDYRFLTRFFVDEQIRIYAFIKDKKTNRTLHQYVEIGNQTEIGLLSDENMAPPFVRPVSTDGILSSVGWSQQETSTRLLFARPENPFEQQVQEQILSLSFTGWLMTGIQIPETSFKPDHIFVLETGAAVIIEDKMHYGTWTGAINGPWRCNGTVIECGTTRGIPDENPMKQVQKYRPGIARILSDIGISDPYVLTTVVAPNDSDIYGVDLGVKKQYSLIKLNQLGDIIGSTKKKSMKKLQDYGLGLPTLDSSILRDAFCISM